MAANMFTRTFDRRVRTLVKTLGLASVLGVAFGMYALWAANMETGYEPEQPIAFSHKVMAGTHEIECLYCHGNAETGPHAGIPTVSECMKCHSEVKGREPQAKERIAVLLEHWEKKKPIEWVKVHDLADFVYFDHSRHIAAGLDCTECHGDVKTMDRVKRVNSLKMGWCLDCHKQDPPEDAPSHQLTRAPIHCSTCHR